VPSPRSRNEERKAHRRGEVLRGCGIWPFLGIDSPLEPAIEPFAESCITAWDLMISGFDAPYQGHFSDRAKRLFLPVPAPRLDSDKDRWERQRPLYVVDFRHYPDDDVIPAKTEHLLLALGSAKEPVAFELFGIGESRKGWGPARIETRFATSKSDVSLVESHLRTLFPRSAIDSGEYEHNDFDRAFESCLTDGASSGERFFAASLCLKAPYCFPLRTFPKLSNDPLSGVIAVIEELREDEWALLQVLFCRARHDWADNLKMACQDPYRPRQFLIDELDRKTLSEKLRSPLYAVSVTLASSNRGALANLQSFVHQYEGPHNGLAVRDAAVVTRPWIDDPVEAGLQWRTAISSRQTLLPGMLLNVEELAGLVHVPSPTIPSERLLRVKSQTRQPPSTVLDRRLIVIGQNVHRGQVRRVAIPPDIRARHCYIAGATGTGKSTLLTTMMIQDFKAGHGVGLLDPHGDLVRVVLRHIPLNRIQDVVLFDAADTQFPIALNILEAGDEAERERIVAETIMSLERYFPASWGPRLERILQYTIRTVLSAIPGATLADVERMLTDAEFRELTLEKTSDSQLRSFWTTQFKFLPKNATDPVLNKLSVFLLDRHVRNIICQRQSAVNFDRLLNEGKILLANLSTGLLTEKVAGTLGSFLVTKIVNAAFRRAALQADRRRPWHLYIDEFQNFVNLSVGFERILAEARKQALTLTAANQHVGQLNQPVRQAIFGNVGTLICFRLGVEDAQTVAKELGTFKAEDILNLEVGQAIARVGGSSTAFNLETFKEPVAPTDNPTRRIVALARQRYARPRREVERELLNVAKSAEKLNALVADEPCDPNEDDLVT
jgi:hypothetical protein